MPPEKVAKELGTILAGKNDDGYLDMDLGSLLASTGIDSAMSNNVELSLRLVSPFNPFERDLEMINTPECYQI